MSERPILRVGSRGDDVRTLQALLASQGFFSGVPLGNFRDLTRSSVKYFQMTHLGPDGVPLEVDGVVGPNTWWALYNPSGPSQESNIHRLLPSVDSEERKKILMWADVEHYMRVKEHPDGSNDSPRIREYLKAVGLGFPAPWCAAFVVCGFLEQRLPFPLVRSGRVQSLWESARDLGLALPSAEYHPRPKISKSP